MNKLVARHHDTIFDLLRAVLCRRLQSSYLPPRIPIEKMYEKNNIPIFHIRMNSIREKHHKIGICNPKACARVIWVSDLELVRILKALADRYGIRCDVSFEELLSYLNMPSYEEDIVSLNEVLN